VHARSSGTAGRPFSRPVGGCPLLTLAALLIALMVATPAAWAGEETEPVAPQPIEVPATESSEPVVEPAEVTPAPSPEAEPVAEPPEAAEPPVEPEVVEPTPPEVEPPAPPEVEPPEPTAPAEVAPAAVVAPDEPAPPPEPEVEEPEPPEPAQAPLAVAENSSTVWQVVWQVQRGCESHCTGTSQSQSAVQGSSTTQHATAQGAPDQASSSGVALNTSVTVQFAWQLQIGCMSFCYDTSQSQLIAQAAETAQVAAAVAVAAAFAVNVAETLQFAWQLQQGCVEECHGTSQTQTIAQQQSTSQSAIVRDGPAGGGSSEPLVIGPDGLPVLPGWLVALAQNVGATIQIIFQFEESSCRHDCVGDMQLQVAAQQATTVQQALVVLAGGEPVPAPAEPQPAPLPGSDPGAGGPAASAASPPGTASDTAAVASVVAGARRQVGSPLGPAKLGRVGQNTDRLRVTRRIHTAGGGRALLSFTYTRRSERSSAAAATSFRTRKFASVFTAPAVEVPAPSNSSSAPAASPEDGAPFLLLLAAALVLAAGLGRVIPSRMSGS
jgi:hypothetical protein